MRRRKVVVNILLLLFLLMSSSVFGLEYTVDVNSPSQVNAYEEDIITNRFSARITNNGGFCDISCRWYVNSMNTQGGPIEIAQDGGSEAFNFEVKAQGSNGIASYSLTITCERIGWNCLASPDTRSLGPYSFTFLYSGDGICTTEKEKCATYNQFIAASSDCSCSSDRKCEPDSNRVADNRGCATFCGNHKVESTFEACDTCPGDVGKCDGISCSIGSECEGKNCVHGACSKYPYRMDDGFCDSNVGENCVNSPKDCACSDGKRCNNQKAVCETYCGNNRCEKNEERICKEDCDWCGDGTCQGGKENCKSCPKDCGICEISDGEAINVKELGEVKKEAQNVAERAKKTRTTINVIIFSTLGLVLLIIVFWLILKRGKKEHFLANCDYCEKSIDHSEKYGKYRLKGKLVYLCEECDADFRKKTKKEQKDKALKK